VVYLGAAGDVLAVLSNCRLLLVLGIREQPLKPIFTDRASLCAPYGEVLTPNWRSPRPIATELEVGSFQIRTRKNRTQTACGGAIHDQGIAASA